MVDRATLLAALLMTATLSALLGPFFWAADLLTHFRALYVVVGVPVLTVLLAARTWKWAGVGAAVIVMNGVHVLPLFFPPSSTPLSDSHCELTLMEANVLTSNTQHERLVRLVTEIHPDVLVLLEVDEAWLNKLAPLREAYPHVVAEPRSDNFGMVVMSKTPYLETSLHELADVGVPAISVRLEYEGRPIEVLAVHTLPPVGHTMASMRNSQLSALAEYAKNSGRSLAVVGDLNTTPWNGRFRKLLRDSGLMDARKGFGIQSTWPAMFWPFAIPIDHCLISGDLRVTRFTTLRSIGSDHFPVLVTIERTR